MFRLLLLIFSLLWSFAGFSIDLTCTQATTSVTEFIPYNNMVWNVTADKSVDFDFVVKFKGITYEKAHVLGNVGSSELVLVSKEGSSFTYMEKVDSKNPIVWTFYLGDEKRSKQFGGPAHIILINQKTTKYPNTISSFTHGYNCKVTP